MEGKFSREGLQALEEDDDMLTAMARELVTENGGGDSADSVWRQIQAENGKILIPPTTTPEPAPVGEDAPLTTSLVTPALTLKGIFEALTFGSRPPFVRPPLRWKEAPPADSSSRCSEGTSAKKRQLRTDSRCSERQTMKLGRPLRP
jgi:hypothetical protein